MTAETSAAAAAAAGAVEEGTQTSTCSKVLFNNSRCGQPLVSASIDHCTVSFLKVDENSMAEVEEEEEEEGTLLVFSSFP